MENSFLSEYCEENEYEKLCPSAGQMSFEHVYSDKWNVVPICALLQKAKRGKDASGTALLAAPFLLKTFLTASPARSSSDLQHLVGDGEWLSRAQ